ncbi:MAG: hypothetical protein R8K47_07760 [Mariprofundaceae bacterium]
MDRYIKDSSQPIEKTMISRVHIFCAEGVENAEALNPPMPSRSFPQSYPQAL